MHTSKLRIHEQSQVVSSRRLVSWGAGRKLAHEKRGEKHLAPTLSPVFRSAFCFFFAQRTNYLNAWKRLELKYQL